LTGYTRTGYCDTNAQDQGTHLICVSLFIFLIIFISSINSSIILYIKSTVTDAFLVYTKAQGNDLSTPRGPSFPGLKAGDNW